MPQKRNPDVLELMRGSVARLRGARSELEWVIGKLPSNYHRDFQLTKAPLLAAAGLTKDLLSLVPSIVKGLAWNTTSLADKMSDDLYSTYAVFRLVAGGTPFRDAYKSVGEQLRLGTFQRVDLEKDFAVIASTLRTELLAFEREAPALQHEVDERTRVFQLAIESVFSGAK